MMLKKSPTQRITISKALEHEFFKKNDSSIARPTTGTKDE
jgi:hypothetical protein